ncbi:MAG TPA: histidine--tRNA ligase [Opitutales bacterium]|nr:histidine--tRNA ligase [Opitutales bacterium]
MASKIQTLPGFRDFPPEACALRNFIFRKWRQTAIAFGFQEYDGPVLEPLELFTEKSGPEIVTQLFNFTDKGDRAVSLRPELTPTLARMVGANAGSVRRPVKWFAIAECFRFEKQQKGRKRSFYQFNADVLGEPGPGADAELIALCIESLRAFGLTADHFVVRLSDRTLWMAFLAGLGLDEAASIKVLAIVDKMERVAPEYTKEQLAPIFGEKTDAFLAEIVRMKAVSSLAELEAWVAALAMPALSERMAAWKELFGTITGMGLSDFCRVDLSIVRGLAYYTGFVFEVFERSGEGRAIAGGGRYDRLIEKLGYQPMAASGFAVGDVTLADLLEGAGLTPKLVHGVDCFIVMGEGERERAEGLKALATLRSLGISADYAIKPTGFGKQFKMADTLGARLTLVFGGDEVAQGIFKMRDMATGGEAVGPIAHLVDGVKLRLAHGIEK